MLCIANTLWCLIEGGWNKQGSVDISQDENDNENFAGSDETHILQK